MSLSNFSLYCLSFLSRFNPTTSTQRRRRRRRRRRRPRCPCKSLAPGHWPAPGPELTFDLDSFEIKIARPRSPSPSRSCSRPVSPSPDVWRPSLPLHGVGIRWGGASPYPFAPSPNSGEQGKPPSTVVPYQHLTFSKPDPAAGRRSGVGSGLPPSGEPGSLFPGREGGVVVRGDDKGCWFALGFVALVVFGCSSALGFVVLVVVGLAARRPCAISFLKNLNHLLVSSTHHLHS